MGTWRPRLCACCENADTKPRAAGLSRRQFTAAALTLAATPIAAGAQTSAPAAPARRIDVHHHFLPDFHLRAVAATREGSTLAAWSPQTSLAEMDRSGVRTAIVSMIQPGVWLGDPAQSRKLARELNEYAAKMVRDYPGRFGFWASLPLPDVDGSLKEIEYALDVLKADGIGLMTSIGDKYLGDPSFAPVFDEINRRGAIVYTHPLTPNCCKGLVPGVPPGTIEYATDTTRTIASLLFSGTATRCPDIRFIFSHGGGTLPFLTGRFVRQAAVQKPAVLPNGPMPELRKFHYEIAQGNTPGQLAALLKLAPLSQILFGTDYPFRPGSEAVEGLTDYGFPVADLAAIERGNALRLLPRLNT